MASLMLGVNVGLIFVCCLQEERYQATLVMPENIPYLDPLILDPGTCG